MSALAMIVAAILLTVLLRSGSSRKVRTLPLTRAQRLGIWRDRFRELMGDDTEDYLQRLARGLQVKDNLLANMRTHVAKSHSLVPVGPLVISRPRRKHSRKSDSGQRHAVAAGAEGFLPRAARGSGNAASFSSGDSYAPL